jgi:hypothetical protein
MGVVYKAQDTRLDGKELSEAPARLKKVQTC